MSTRNTARVRGPLTDADRALVGCGINLALRDSAIRDARNSSGDRRSRLARMARTFNRIAITFRKVGVTL